MNIKHDKDRLKKWMPNWFVCKYVKLHFNFADKVDQDVISETDKAIKKMMGKA